MHLYSIVFFLCLLVVNTHAQSDSNSKAKPQDVIICETFWSYTCIEQETVEREVIANYITLVFTEKLVLTDLKVAIEQMTTLLNTHLVNYKPQIEGYMIGYVMEEDPLFVTLKLKKMSCAKAKELQKKLNAEKFIHFTALSVQRKTDLGVEHVMNSCLVNLRKEEDVALLRQMAKKYKAELRLLSKWDPKIYVLELSKTSVTNDPWEAARQLYGSKLFSVVLARTITGVLSGQSYKQLK